MERAAFVGVGQGQIRLCPETRQSALGLGDDALDQFAAAGEVVDHANDLAAGHHAALVVQEQAFRAGEGAGG